MTLDRLVITAVVVEGRSYSAVVRDYGISRVWVQKLVHRYQREGPAAFEPRSWRPHSKPRAVDLDVQDQIVRLRKTLTRRVSMPARRPSSPTYRPPGSQRQRCRRSGGFWCGAVRDRSTVTWLPPGSIDTAPGWRRGLRQSGPSDPGR